LDATGRIELPLPAPAVATLPLGVPHQYPMVPIHARPVILCM